MFHPLYLLQNNTDNKKGLLGNFETINNLQNSFGIIDQTLKEISENTKSIDNKLGDINENLKKLSNIGGLISNPTSPSGFYHNSIIYRQRGEVDNSLNSLNCSLLNIFRDLVENLYVINF